MCPSDLRIRRGERLGCAIFILSKGDKDEPLVFKLEDQIMRALPPEQTTECISFHRVHQNLNTLRFNICNPTTGCLCPRSVMEKCQFAPSIPAKYSQRPAFCCHALFTMATADFFLHSSSIISLYQPGRFSQAAPKPERNHNLATAEQDQHGPLPVKTPQWGGN